VAVSLLRGAVPSKPTRLASADVTPLRAWLENTQGSTLTAGGLVAVRNALVEGEIGVFFRSGHFSTVLKKGGHVYTLTSDQVLAAGEVRSPNTYIFLTLAFS
jgi:hypothetical protein